MQRIICRVQCGILVRVDERRIEKLRVVSRLLEDRSNCLPEMKTTVAVSPTHYLAADRIGTHNVIAWSSLAFAVLQSICTFFAAMNGLRFGIGISSLVLAAATAKSIDSFHVDWLRIPMISLAVVGSVLNLVVLWQIRRLRRLPEAQWRQTPPTRGRIRMERMQFLLSIVTLTLVSLEERQHLIWLHRL
jgi:hypothetical protein